MSGGGHNEAKFKQTVLRLSEATSWDEAKAEWILDFVYDDPSDRSCECEHSPIHQICIIRNERTGNKTEVGNVCVKRFLRLLSQRVFSVIKRIRDDISRSLNPKALEVFRIRSVITPQEEQEYLQYWRRRKHMDDNQKDQKISINERVLAYVDEETPKLIAAARAQGLKV